MPACNASQTVPTALLTTTVSTALRDLYSSMECALLPVPFFTTLTPLAYVSSALHIVQSASTLPIAITALAPTSITTYAWCNAQPKPIHIKEHLASNAAALALTAVETTPAPAAYPATYTSMTTACSAVPAMFGTILQITAAIQTALITNSSAT